MQCYSHRHSEFRMLRSPAERAHKVCSGRTARKDPFLPPRSQEHDFWQESE